MNAAHLHLVLVHIPIVLVPTGLIIFLIAWWKNNPTLRLVALSFFFFSALLAFPIAQLGDNAEHAIEGLPGVVESAIYPHEESGERAMYALIILGLFTAIGYRAYARRAHTAKLFSVVITALALLCTVMLFKTADKGGQIRHPEAFGAAAQPEESATK